MNVKRFIVASIAVFLTFQILDFIVHTLILGSCYSSEALANLWRPDMMSMMWLMYLSGLILSFVFVYIFIKGYSGKGIMEGVRFGLLIGILISVVGIINQYVIYPIPIGLAAGWLISGLIEFIIVGIVVALVYKPKA